MSEWRRNNPDKVAEYNLERRLHKTHTLTKNEWIACKDYFKNEKDEWSCAYCGLPINQHFRWYGGKLQNIDLHKEHFDDCGGNDITNCVPSCQSCNSEKHIFDFEDWYTENNPKYSKERNEKIIKWITEDCFIYLQNKILA